MTMADLNSGHTLGILTTIFIILCSIFYFALKKQKPGHSLAFSNFMTASKSIVAPASLVISLIILVVYIADRVLQFGNMFFQLTYSLPLAICSMTANFRRSLGSQY